VSFAPSLSPMPSPATQKIIVALDAPDADSALRLAGPLMDTGCLFKIGLQLFTAEGPAVVRRFREAGARVFLDLKFHDIPNTAREAICSILPLDVEMTTIHLAGGPDMVAASIGAARDTRLLVLGVTVLTSMDAPNLSSTGVTRSPEEQVLGLAGMGVSKGLRGVVASPLEIVPLRKRFGRDLVIVTPGVRPPGADRGDQKRVLTPAEAVAAGADYLVVGRPVTSASAPRDALLRIAETLDTAS